MLFIAQVVITFWVVGTEVRWNLIVLFLENIFLLRRYNNNHCVKPLTLILLIFFSVRSLSGNQGNNRFSRVKRIKPPSWKCKQNIYFLPVITNDPRLHTHTKAWISFVKIQEGFTWVREIKCLISVRTTISWLKLDTSHEDPKKNIQLGVTWSPNATGPCQLCAGAATGTTSVAQTCFRAAPTHSWEGPAVFGDQVFPNCILVKHNIFFFTKSFPYLMFSLSVAVVELLSCRGGATLYFFLCIFAQKYC